MLKKLLKRKEKINMNNNNLSKQFKAVDNVDFYKASVNRDKAVLRHHKALLKEARRQQKMLVKLQKEAENIQLLTKAIKELS